MKGKEGKKMARELSTDGRVVMRILSPVIRKNKERTVELLCL